jgi:glutathione S-transferase
VSRNSFVALGFIVLNYRSRNLETDEARLKEYTEKLGMKLDGHEAILSKQKYLAGDVSISAY